MNLFDLSAKKAIVTGGTRGLGYGMAEGLLEAGAAVVIIGTSKTVYTAAKAFCDRGLLCKGVIADLSDGKQRISAFEEAVQLLGGLDILVNCAGIQRRHPVQEFPIEDWDAVLETNLTASFHLSQLATNEFLKKEKPSGKIINVASMLSFFGGSTVVAYAASKGGVAQMTKAFCNELAAKGINVNAIAPGYMDTELNTALTDPDNPRCKEITDRIPAGRWGSADDLKGAAVFLASAASDYVNGAIIPVDGGYLVK